MDSLVLTNVDISGFINYVLDKHTKPSVIVVCMTREAFLQQLSADLTKPDRPGDSKGLLQQPTLRILATSQTVKLAFCPDVTNLRAYLAAFPARNVQDALPKASASGDHAILALLNLLELHRPTSAFSAQGLNRTFAPAVEAAHHTGHHLVVAECTIPHTADPGVEQYEATTTDQPGEVTVLDPCDSPSNPWDEEVSILNVTTKSFGAGGRGWVGRTVKLRHVAERWCRFEDLHVGQSVRERIALHHDSMKVEWGE
jgi:hypothetical protein